MTGGDRELMICFGTYNIRNGRNGGLKLDMRGMDQENINLGVFQYTKFTDGVHTRMLTGYRVFATNDLIRHIGGVAVFYWDDAPHFQVESMHQHRINVLCFQVDSGRRRWFIIGC